MNRFRNKMSETCTSTNLIEKNSIETQPSIEDGEEIPNINSKSTQYKIAMPVISFKKMTANTKPDKKLNCLNLIGTEWMAILQKSIATSEGVSEFKMNVNYSRLLTLNEFNDLTKFK